MGLFGLFRRKRKEEAKSGERVFQSEQSEQLTDYRQKKDWTGWKVVPRPDLKNPITGEPIVFPPPPEDWKEYGWAVLLWHDRVGIDPATGRYIRIERDDTYGYVRFYEPDGKLRGEFRWVLGDGGQMWTKPKDVKERAKVVDDFLVNAHMTHASLYLFPHCARTLVHTAGRPGSTSYYRTGLVAIDVEGAHFTDPPELERKRFELLERKRS
jgi:hypothetical protein